MCGGPRQRAARIHRAWQRRMEQRNPPTAQALERMGRQATDTLTAAFDAAMAPSREREAETQRLMEAAQTALEELGMANAQQPNCHTWSVDFQSGITISGVMYGDDVIKMSYQPVGDDEWRGNEGSIAMRQQQAYDVQVQGAHLTGITADAEKLAWSAITEFVLAIHQVFPDAGVTIKNGQTERAGIKESQYQEAKALLERKAKEEEEYYHQSNAAGPDDAPRYETAHARLEERVSNLEDLTRELLDRCTTERAHLRGDTQQVIVGLRGELLKADERLWEAVKGHDARLTSELDRIKGILTDQRREDDTLREHMGKQWDMINALTAPGSPLVDKNEMAGMARMFYELREEVDKRLGKLEHLARTPPRITEHNQAFNSSDGMGWQTFIDGIRAIVLERTDQHYPQAVRESLVRYAQELVAYHFPPDDLHHVATVANLREQLEDCGKREIAGLARQGHLEQLLYGCAQREAAQERCDTCGEPHGTSPGCEECAEALGETMHYTYHPEQRGPRQPVPEKERCPCGADH